MTDVPSAPSILALHLGLLEAHAAVDRAGRIDLVALGGDRAGMPMVLHVSTGGDVAVGEDAIRRAVDDPDGFVDDVMGHLFDDGVVEASGRTLTAEAVLAHLMAQSYAACLRILDGAPEQVVVVRAAGGPDEATYEAAAGRGLVGDVRVLDETRAWSAFSGHAPPATRGMEPEHTGVLGALLWLRHGDAPTGPKPIVTREDIEGSAPEPLRQPSAPSVVSVGPRSVFDAPPSKPPDPSDPAPVRHRPRRTPVPLLVFLLIVVLAVLGYQRFLADEVPTTTEATTTTEVPTTTEATTTTEVPTTTEPPPTTTRPPLGPVSISGQGLLLFAASDDSTFLELGGPVDTTLDAVSAVLGDPDRDSGWVSDPSCAGSSVRRVGFGSLELVLVDRDPTDAPPAEDVPEGGDTAEGAETTTTVAPPGEPGFGAEFGRWFLSGADSVDSGFWTLERIGVGSTVADVRLAYPDGFSVVQTDQADPAGFFDLDPIGLAGPISGATSNTTDEGRVLQLWAGSAC